jgi:hypothetical protein
MTGTDLLARIAAVEERIDCGGARHRLGWAAGSLASPDHPDPEGERLLGSLGATRPRCLEMLDAWAAHQDDLRMLTLGPRHAADQVGAHVDAVAAVRTGNFARNVERQRAHERRIPPGVVGGTPRGPFSLEEQEEQLRRHLGLLTLLTLPPSLQHRLMVTVAARQLHRPGEHDAAMTAALVGRARIALRSWAGEGYEVEVRLGKAATVARVGHGVSAELPAEWLVTVWGAELAVVDGHFVCQVLEMGPGTWTVRALAPTGEELELSLGRIGGTEAWTVLRSRR